MSNLKQRTQTRAAELYAQAIVWDMIWPCHPSDPPQGNTWDKNVVFDEEGLSRWARARPDEWPMTQDPQWPGFSYAMPEHLLDLTELLLADGFSDSDVRGILGENYLRVCREVWAAPKLKHG